MTFMKNTNEAKSSQPTGDGEQSALLCAGCGAQLLDTEVYACTSCLDLWCLLDPNGFMGDDDEESQEEV